MVTLKAIRQVTDKPEKAEVITAAWAANTASEHGGRILSYLKTLDDLVNGEGEDVIGDGRLCNTIDSCVTAIKESLGAYTNAVTMRGMLVDDDILLTELFGDKVPVEIVDWDPHE